MFANGKHWVQGICATLLVPALRRGDALTGGGSRLPKARGGGPRSANTFNLFRTRSVQAQRVPRRVPGDEGEGCFGPRKRVFGYEASRRLRDC